MTLAEAMETTRIPRVAGWTGRHAAFVTTRPFRAPPHPLADVGCIGGQIPVPGEVSRAHHGLVQADEVIREACRHPLRGTGSTRAKRYVTVELPGSQRAGGRNAAMRHNNSRGAGTSITPFGPGSFLLE
jgi:magnesium chelatase family protein